MNIDPRWIGGRLRELRRQAKLTQEELADKAGLSRAGIAPIESGKNVPSWDTVVKLCTALGVGCAEFMKPPTTDKPGRGRPPGADAYAAPKSPKGAATPKPRRKRGD